MALSTISWEIGFVIGPAAGGLILALSPLALWPIAAGVCVGAGAAAHPLERRIPQELRLTPAYRVSSGGFWTLKSVAYCSTSSSTTAMPSL